MWGRIGARCSSLREAVSFRGVGAHRHRYAAGVGVDPQACNRHRLVFGALKHQIALSSGFKWGNLGGGGSIQGGQ